MNCNKILLINIAENNGNGILHVYTSNNAIVTLDEIEGKISYRVRKNKFSDYPTIKYALPSLTKDIKINVNDLITSTSKILRELKNNRISVTPEDALINIKTITAAYLSSTNNNKKIYLKKMKKNINFKWP